MSLRGREKIAKIVQRKEFVPQTDVIRDQHKKQKKAAAVKKSFKNKDTMV